MDVAREAGGTFLYAYNANNALPRMEVGNFAVKLNLVAEVPQNYTPKAYHRLLGHGPLWVGTAIFADTGTYGHARVVTGIEGDGTFDGTTLHIVDPDGGRLYRETVFEFAQELEAIAASQGKSVLFPQVIRLP